MRLVRVYMGTDILPVPCGSPLRSFSNYANHLPQTIREASGLQTAITYNAQGQPTLVTRSKAGKSESTRFTYDRNLDGTPDSDGYLIRVEKTSESGAFVLAAAYGYDAAGRVRTQTDADGYTVTLDYDNIDRVTLVTHPDGTTEQTDYRWLDPVAVKDRGGLWSRTQYNALRKPVLVQDPAGLVTQLEWCKCGDIQKITDPSGNLTQWRRDAQGRVFEKVYPDQSRELMSYQPLSGRLAATTRPGDAGPTITYGYALSGGLTREDYLAADTPDVRYEYNDFMGRLTRRVDGAGATAYGYHPLDGATAGAGQTATVDGPLADDTFAYGYDWGDRQVSSRLLADSGAVLRSEALSIDSLGRVATVTNGLGTFANVFNPGNNGPRIDRRTGPGGFSLSAGYFPPTTQAGRALKLQSLEYAINGAAPFASHRYDYDASGRITAWEQDRGGVRDAYALGYDRSSWLIESVKTGASGGEARSWRYDGAGNRILSNQGAATTPSFYNGLNQVLRVGGSGRTLIEGTVDETATVKVNGQPAQTASAPGSGQMVFRKMVEVAEGSNVVEIEARDASNNVRSERWRFEVGGVRRRFEYDAAGNTIADGTRLYAWDAANRLRSVTVGGSVYEWEYDGLSRRVLEKRDGTVRKRFVWDAERLVQERDGENRVLRTYYGDGFEEGGKIYVYAKDHLGSVREVVDAAGGVVAARYDYDLWGGRSKLAGNAETPWGYTGHSTHAETGLVLALYRAYDPDTGRWLSRDPIEDGEMRQGPNLYQYVRNSPVIHVDPTGLFLDTIWDLGNMAYDAWNGQWDDFAADALSAAVPFVPAGASKVCKAANKGFGRTARNLMDQMVLDAAKQGKGRKIIDSLGDPKFKGMEKWSYNEKSAAGVRCEVHYVRDPKTGDLMDFKFKHRTD
jgi:RHS repeat-associated protein